MSKVILQNSLMEIFFFNHETFPCLFFLGDSGKVTTVVATPGQGPDRPQEVSYTDIKVSRTEESEVKV